MMLASYGSDLEDGEVQLRDEDLRPSDVVFSARHPRYENMILERVKRLEERWGNVQQWDRDAIDQEADLAVAELKEGGGRLLKPESGPGGKSPITGYSLMSDEDALKRKFCLSSRDLYLALGQC